MSFRGQQWKDALSMHRNERRGSLLLLAGCVAAAAWVTYEQWIRPSTPVELAVRSTAMEAWSGARSQGRDSLRAEPSKGERITLFPFDPNGLPLDQWTALGLSDRQAAAIHRYEASGGRFRSKRDLARMRVVAPELFVQWMPYILLPDSLPPRTEPSFKDPERGDGSWTRYSRDAFPRSVEVNTADSAALVALPGIGPAFARGILKYRDKLGGYRSLEQLAEVYVLKDKPDAVTSLKERLVVDTTLVHRIRLNTASADELAAHPYVGWKVAKALVAYRGQHGAFTDITGIKGCVLINDTLFRKLAPYLQVP